MKISVVIPTRNRIHNLNVLLGNLEQQTLKPDEVIVVDSSDNKTNLRELLNQFSKVPLIVIDSIPSVCVQRNIGIRKATGTWIFLCDDDIELPANYLEVLSTYLSEHKDCGVVAGSLLQLENGSWVESYPVKTWRDLLWRFVFQLSVWGEINEIKFPLMLKPLGRIIRKFYSKRGNGLSKAGWPLLTNWNGQSFQSTIYSLGANLIRREWLLNSPYDEILDPSGIGDNFGVALGFPERRSIHVLRTVHAYHHRSQENRLLQSTIYYRRILALHYFLKRKNRNASILWLIWSLWGNLILYLIKGDSKRSWASLKAILQIVLNKNPYWTGFFNKQKIVQPQL
jgi:glycosyltransferase involved in cell wall biosynthesis